MKKLLGVTLLSMTLFGLAGCNDETVPIPEYVPDVPVAAQDVLGHNYTPSTNYWADNTAARAQAKAGDAPQVASILSKNIQNLLCNAVHHSREGRQEQAYHKLDLAKNDKLVKMLSKGQITEAEYTELDTWMAELIELLYENVYKLAAAERSFPFSCEGQDEETEAVGEVIEIDVDDEVPAEEEPADPDPTDAEDPDPVDPEEAEVAEPAENTDRFIKKVCFSTFAGETHDYLSAADYLINADVLAHHIFHNPATSDEYKQSLRGWLHKIHQVLILHTNEYTSDNMPFSCERYRARYKPSGLSSSVNDIVNVVVGVVRDVVDGIGDFFDRIF